jgi:hypothetical protein
MARHSKPIDTGPTAVLDLSDLTVMELAALVNSLRNAQLTAGVVSMREVEDFDALERMWYEFASLRMEVRSAFLARFFDVT